MNYTAFRRAAATLILAVLVMAPTAALAQGDSYAEGFDNGAPDWKLDGGWSAGRGFLTGREQGAALYAGKDGWHDAHYKAVIRSLDGTANFTFMNTLHQWYYVTLQTGDGTVAAQLYYTQLGAEFPPQLGSATITYGSDQIKASGLSLEVDVKGRDVTVSLNGEPQITYTSEVDEPPGTIGFEILQQSQIIVDEVSVDVAAQPTEPPTMSPGEDLALTGMRLRGVRRGSVIADLSVDVGNLGDTPSLPTQLVVYDQDQPDVKVVIQLDPIQPGGARTIDVSLEGPDDWANTTRHFIALIDPQNALNEANRNNNQLTSGALLMNITSGGGAIPSGPSQSGPPPGLLPVVLGGLGVLGLAVAGGLALTVSNQFTIGNRQKLQKEAQPGKPPDSCTPPGRYVEVENEVDLKLLKVTQLEIELLDPNTHASRRKAEVKEKLPGTLNTAVRGSWLREPHERAAEHLAALVKELAKAIEREAYREKDVCDVTVSAHLEGLELTSTFTLYHCKKTGADGAWKKVASWEVKKQQERDDALFGLEQLDSQATSMAMRLEALIEPLLRGYLDRYRS